jgi:signal transduction histidine kinase
MNSSENRISSEPMSAPLSARYWNSELAQNWTGALVLLIVGMLSVFMNWEDTREWNSETVITAILAASVVLTFISFISHWAMALRSRQFALLWLEALLIIPLYFLVDISFIAILGIVWIVQVAEIVDIHRTMWLLLVAVTVFTIAQFYHWYGTSIFAAVVGSVTLGMFHLFAVITTHRANREQLLREQTAALNRELIATRELLTQSSRQSERLRIARDLHDLLGHHMTALILNLEVATHCTEGKALQKVEQSLALGKLLLSDLRTAVSELREDENINLRQSVEKLVADIPNLQISVDFSAAPAIHDVEIAETLLRCIQEAITNVLRHSKASHCRIALTEAYNEFFLTVKDNGRGGTSMGAGIGTGAGAGKSAGIVAGNGLKGMSERVQEAGGEVSWRQEQDGFLLQLRLPTGDSA